MANASAPSYCFPRRPARLGLAGYSVAQSAPRPHVPSLSVKTATGACVSILNDASNEQAAAMAAGSVAGPQAIEYRRSSSLPHLVLAQDPSLAESSVPQWTRMPPPGFSSSMSTRPGLLPSLSALVTAVEMVSPPPMSLSSPATPSLERLSPMTACAPGYNPHMVAPAGTKTMAKRRYRCSFEHCGKAFTTSGHLARHQRIHTGEKNFACQYPGCSSRFSRQDNMMQHYRTHLSPKSRRNTSPRDSAPPHQHQMHQHHPYMVNGQYARTLPMLQHLGPVPQTAMPSYHHAGMVKQHPQSAYQPQYYYTQQPQHSYY
ncbi:regulatory region nucleic acid binding [Coemansia aciculifera]|uniref:Regulatory region nucleic acid binding n=1 Tax=Coemansia aciculifera TaxID=417176 RepID=A0ACC1M0H3_9FUNG|nr:regulatory region nucleic acid binding [Coemansia aciculifera]